MKKCNYLYINLVDWSNKKPHKKWGFIQYPFSKEPRIFGQGTISIEVWRTFLYTTTVALEKNAPQEKNQGVHLW